MKNALVVLAMLCMAAHAAASPNCVTTQSCNSRYDCPGASEGSYWYYDAQCDHCEVGGAAKYCHYSSEVCADANASDGGPVVDGSVRTAEAACDHDSDCTQNDMGDCREPFCEETCGTDAACMTSCTARGNAWDYYQLVVAGVCTDSCACSSGAGGQPDYKLVVIPNDPRCAAWAPTTTTSSTTTTTTTSTTSSTSTTSTTKATTTSTTSTTTTTKAPCSALLVNKNCYYSGGSLPYTVSVNLVSSCPYSASLVVDNLNWMYFTGVKCYAGVGCPGGASASGTALCGGCSASASGITKSGTCYSRLQTRVASCGAYNFKISLSVKFSDGTTQSWGTTSISCPSSWGAAGCNSKTSCSTCKASGCQWCNNAGTPLNSYCESSCSASTCYGTCGGC